MGRTEKTVLWTSASMGLAGPVMLALATEYFPDYKFALFFGATVVFFVSACVFVRALFRNEGPPKQVEAPVSLGPGQSQPDQHGPPNVGFLITGRGGIARNVAAIGHDIGFQVEGDDADLTGSMSLAPDPRTSEERALAAWIEQRQTFSLREAACMLAGVGIMPEPVTGLAAGYLEDLRAAIADGSVVPVGVDKLEIQFARTARRGRLLHAHEPILSSWKIEKEALRQFAIRNGATILGLT